MCVWLGRAKGLCPDSSGPKKQAPYKGAALVGQLQQKGVEKSTPIYREPAL
ncbi:pyridoxamine 5'-phosphate oxidase [Acetobacter orientalis]|uniref:Pyridoxamine 5'-phosphate oxidase n=1 Tax=Acetobacter orientalis TaxID=146474 RepID=A0A2Z5ZID4_9PROT|nr:pyridoxamine 5'-phosphate oxidase [Acetobacter orientalis]